jgi:hypothetical protein
MTESGNGTRLESVSPAQAGEGSNPSTSAICTRCKTNPPQAIYHPWCRECRRTSNRRWWKSVSRQMIDSRKDTRRTRNILHRKRIFDYLLEHPCVDCGERNPIVLDFDHVREVKSDSVSKMTQYASWSRIETEIRKCDVRCSNCHRIRTSSERGDLFIELLKESGQIKAGEMLR